MSIFLLSLLFLLAAPTQQTTAQNSVDLCTVQGVVVKAGTGDPLSRATVVASPVLNRTGRDESEGGFTETDEKGRFELRDLAPGQYFLSAEHNGFSPQQYGQRTPEGPGAILTLSRNQTVLNITFQLIPAAVITGHVYYEDGEPVLDAVVSAMRFTYLNGQRRMVGVGTKQTNDLGEYRIYGLAPGKYIVQAAPRTKQVQNPASKQGYEPIYYPGVPDAEHAAPVAVRAGDEVPSIDITLQPVPTVTVRGHVFSAGCGEAVRDGTVFLTAQNSSLSLGSRTLNSGGLPPGVFEFRNVPSGSYYLYATTSGRGRPCIGRQALEVADADIDGVGVAVSPGAQIRGRLSVEGQINSNLGAFAVTLVPKSTNLLFSTRPSGAVSSDGSFLLTNISDNDYDVYVGLPENYYLKSGRLNGVDVLTAGVSVDSKHSPGLLDILVSANGASVDGVISKDQQPFPGATVTLVPDPPLRGEERLFKSVTTDRNGHFVLEGLPPGDYKVFAWEKIEPGAYTSAEFLQPFETRGESVHIMEGSRQSVQVDLIPAKDLSP